LHPAPARSSAVGRSNQNTGYGSVFSPAAEKVLCLYRQTILLAMKLTATFLLLMAMHVSASGFSQTVTLSVKDVPLAQVFKKIKKQTGLSFLWDEQAMKVSHSVTINVKDAPLQQVLDACIKNHRWFIPLSIYGVDKAEDRLSLASQLMVPFLPVIPRSFQQIFKSVAG